MEFAFSSCIAVLIFTTLITFSFCFFSQQKIHIKKLPMPPEAAGGWPFIGHLPLLSGSVPIHITLSEIADKYGPVFTIRLGSRRGLIVNTSETAKECFRTNDVAFSNRPKTAAMGLMGYNYAMVGFSSYGPYWREMRKISVLRLLSNKKVAILGNVREIEVKALMKSIYGCYLSTCVGKEKGMCLVDMRKILGNFTLSLMVRTVAGDVEKKMDLEEKEKWRNTIREFFKMMSVFTVSDVIPSLKWLDECFGRMHKALKRTGRNFDSMLQAWVEEHRRNMKSTIDLEQEGDFMDEMLSLADSVAAEFPVYDADTINKATCQTMMVGGSDTMSVTLIWTLSLLLNNRHTLKRAQDELDTQIGRERQVKESDIEDLVYIKAIIKESMRLQPPVPVNPRETGEDCVVAGYHVPAGTRVFINTWKIQRDPHVWADPLEFRPERFLTTHMGVDVLGLHFELVPFGGGRRVCPGISFALKSMQFALASLLHGFDIETPGEEVVDMSGSFGTTNMKATPLEVLLSPRLSPELYA